jgi:ribosomal protein S18 acetylase RimI-like enzyme
MYIVQATPADLPIVRDLFWEYLQWLNPAFNHAFRTNFDLSTAATLLEQDMAGIGKFMPPDGRLLLARADAGVRGCICMRTISPSVAEVKRLYVRPSARRAGVGRALLDALIADIQSGKYAVLRLDSAPFMHEARALYRSRGFQEIAPYPESEVPEAFWPHWLFMERPIAAAESF